MVALAVGLGTVDTPVPSIEEWAWLNWRFPRPIHAGDTLYSRWTLTQKRPPVGGARSSIVVWRVDVHTADGALCAEGEIGAKVKRRTTRAPAPATAEAATGAPVPPGGVSRRRRRRTRSNGGPSPEPPSAAAPPAAAARPERAAGPSRRRRRRRPSQGQARDEEHEPRAAHAPETKSEPPPAPLPQPTAAPVRQSRRKGLGGVLRRLRGTATT